MQISYTFFQKLFFLHFRYVVQQDYKRFCKINHYICNYCLGYPIIFCRLLNTLCFVHWFLLKTCVLAMLRDSPHDDVLTRYEAQEIINVAS